MMATYGGTIWLVLVLGLCAVCPAESILTFSNCPLNMQATRSAPVYWSPPTVTSSNAASDFTVVGTHQPGRYFYMTTTVTYTAMEGAETVPCTFDIIITDNGSPVITSCPDDLTASAPSGQTQVSVSWDAPQVEDSANVQVTSTKNPNDQFGIGRNTVTYTFSFTNVNNAPQSFCSFDIFVQESGPTTVPTLQCPTVDPITLALGQESTAVTWDDPTYPTELGETSVVCGRQKNDLFFEGHNDITCVAYFESGETRMCSFTVTIMAPTDNENPSILNCPADIREYVAVNSPGKVVTWTEPTITDNTQQNLNLQATHTNGIFYNVGTYDVTYTGSDASGNDVRCTFRIYVEVDDVSPLIDGCLAPTYEVFVKAGETSGVISWEEPSVTDTADPNPALQGPTVTLISGTTTLVNGGTINVGDSHTVSYVATDAFGNTQNCVFTVTLSVDQVPVYSGCSSDTSYPADAGKSYTNVTWPEPRVTDDRNADQLILTKSYEPGMNYEIGVYIVEYTATDAIGNVGICSFVVTVEDKQNPVVTVGSCPASQSFPLGPSENGKEVTWMNPSATDNSCSDQSNCDTVLVISSDRSPGIFTTGTYPVTITVTDPSGNTDTSCTFTITINSYVPDGSLPVWTNCPNDSQSNTDSGQPTKTVPWTVPTATDDRGVISEFASHTPPFAFPIGTHTVTYRATDAANNVGLCEFVVTITDNERPVWTAGSGCGTTISHYVLSDRSTNLQIALPAPTATDNSNVTPTISNSLTSSARYPFPSGITTIRYTAADTSGNTNPDCVVTVSVTQEQRSDIWSVRGSLTLSRIRGVSGVFTDASATVLLAELATDMDQLMRSSSIGSHFVGIDSLTHTFVNGNPKVSYRLYFTKNRQGRHTSRQITEAFYAAVPSNNIFSTENVIVPGTLEFHVREFKLTTKITGRNSPTNNAVFLSQYDTPSSSQYQALEDLINTQMDAVYDAFFGYAVSVVVDFRSGSIDNDVVLVFDDTSVTTENNIINQFRGQLDGNGQLFTSGLYYSPTDTLNQELCPADECQNGGSCSVDASYTNVCTCPDGYSGTNCETVPTTGLSTVVIAAIIGGALLLLILLFALFCCCIYLCRGPVTPYKDPYPVERPFQIIDDEASVESSMDVFLMPRPRDRYYVDYVEAPPVAPVIHRPRPPPLEGPTLHLNDEYGMNDDMYGRRMLPSTGPSFSPDGEVYVTGPNQVAIRPSTKRGQYYRY